MSKSRSLVYFVEERPPEIQRSIRGLVEVAGPDCEIRSMFAADAGTEFVRFKNGHPACDKEAIDNRPERKYIESNGSVDEVIGVSTRYPWVRVSMGSEREERLWEAVRYCVPLDVSGKSGPLSFEIIIGSCDWTEEPPTSRGLSPCVYFGRSELAFVLQGFREPLKPKVYWEMLLKLPEYIELQRDIEGVLGPVKRCVAWRF